MPNLDVDRLIRGWRGPALAALIAFLAGLPGLMALPPLDRDESRFAQATTQMLETRDFVNISFQDTPRHKKPVGIHWLQAASVSLFSSPWARQIWAFRIPSLLGAMAAAAACAWGATRFFGARGGVLAGIALGTSFILSTEAGIAKTDAVLCGATTLALAALGRLYAQAKAGERLQKRLKLVFWIAMSVSILIKGPIGPMVAALTLIALGFWDRQWRWIGKLGWKWGPLVLLLICGPWALAITVATDGSFWTTAVTSDLASKVAGGQEGHSGPPGYHLLLLPLLLFPATLLMPAGFASGWRHRASVGVRFALCWLVPSWLVFELAPTKLVHYTLPLYGAVAWLIASLFIPLEPSPQDGASEAAHAISAFLGRTIEPVWRPIASIGWSARWIGAALSAFAAIVVSAIAIVVTVKYGGAALDWVWVALTVACAVIGAGAGIWLLFKRDDKAKALLVTCAGGLLAHACLVGGLAPRMTPLWLSRSLARAVIEHHIDPRNGVTPGPIAVLGYAEPSVVFLLGTETQLIAPVDTDDAADAIGEGRPVAVDSKDDSAFQAQLAKQHLTADVIATVRGVNYSKGKPVTLTLYLSKRKPAT
ncbi:MAG TPA: glycosyltransferase family 39 protein [Caulobacteraceae bacterium]|jgi:4-amino-4-deoxy-L-arabinose transferase-like glycosyltransferase|nr:glycosyltransferase family 39 protein [Caulobacteraceae bacterium]